MKKKYQSKILGAIHEEAQSLYEAGVIDDIGMKEFDDACLVPTRTKKTVMPLASAKVNTPQTAVFASPKR